MIDLKLKNHLFSALAIILFLFLTYGSDDTNTSSTTFESTEPAEKVIPKMTEVEYCNYFQIQWDSIKLIKLEGFPQYETYMTSLSDVNQDMLTISEKDTAFKFDSPTKLNKLRLKFIKSKKNKDAMKNWLTYGQPSMDFDLKIPCEMYLKSNANDPESIEVEDWKIKGQSKNGWHIIMKYRGKNAYGGLVLNVTTFDVRFNPSDKAYYVNSAW